MSQTNAIILRIAKDRTKEFEALFAAEQYPHWKEMHAKGQMLARKADAFQPEGPSVYGGTTIFEIGGGA
jgi:hypothetical protein